jgi:hypothetical protein
MFFLFYFVPIYCKIDYLFFIFIAETNTKQTEKSQSNKQTAKQQANRNKQQTDATSKSQQTANRRNQQIATNSKQTQPEKWIPKRLAISMTLTRRRLRTTKN